MAKRFAYIDLFAGCGGLSLGLEKAGFELELAVEKSDMAAETFYHNFISRIVDKAEWETFSSADTDIEFQAKKKLVVKELKAVLECKKLLKQLKQKNIDLVAGGPPCQGFSLAGKRNPKDIRNQLPWQFLEFVAQIHPKAVIIENVSGMQQNFKKHNQKSPFEELRIALSETGPGYFVQPVLLNSMHFGVPQHRPRVMLLGIRKDIGDALGLRVYDETWKSDYDQVGSISFPKKPDLAPKTTHFGQHILTVRDALWDLDAKGYKCAYSDKKYLKDINLFAREMRGDTSWMPAQIKKATKHQGLPNHNLRNHAEHIELRFRLYQYLRDQGISSKVLLIPKQADVPKSGQILLIKEYFLNAKFPAKAPDGTVIAKNISELVEVILSLGTKKHSQRPLRWDSPSPTVVSLPDDYVHPDEPRTLTVREMARFQSFPDSFEFRAKETTGSLRRRVEVPQYTQVGNAVPPKMAFAVGNVFYEILSAYIEKSRKVPNAKRAV